MCSVFDGDSVDFAAGHINDAQDKVALSGEINGYVDCFGSGVWPYL